MLTHRPLVGRQAELRRLRDAVRRGLVVVVGPAGVGKTRLAEEALAPVAPVPLADVRGPLALTRAVAAALDVPDPDPERIAAAWAARRDGVWLDAADGLDDDALRLLAGWAGPGTLVTSRRRLGLSGEEVVFLEPLPLPDAVELFLARAAEAGFTPADADGPRVEVLVERLERLPLALELAAGRLRALGLDGLEGFDALRRAAPDRPERERSLEASIAATWSLLSPAEQEALAGASRWVGPFEVADLGWLGREGPDLLARLVDWSLARVAAGAARLQLWEGVRAFASARVDAALGARVDAAIVERARRLDADRFGPGEAAAVRALERALPTLAAIAERSAPEALPDVVLVMDAALQGRGPAPLRRQWLAAAARRATGPAAAALLARRVQTEPGVDLDAELAAALAAGPEPELAAALRLASGRAAWNRGDLPLAEARFAEALQRASSPRDRLTAGYALGGVRSARGDSGGALRTFEEALAEAREHGSGLAEGLVLGAMGVVAHDVDLPDGEGWLRRAVAGLEALGDPRASSFRVRLADRALERGDRGAAAREVDAALGALAAAGQLRLLGHAHGVRALVHEAASEVALARDHLQRGEALEARHGSRAVQGLLASWRARLEADAGVPEAAEAALQRAAECLGDRDPPAPWAHVRALAAGHLALRRGDRAPAEAALASSEPAGGRSSEVRAARARLAAALAGEALVVGADGAWFELRGARVDLATRLPIRRVLVALAAAEGPLDVEALFGAGWPGEKATRDAARDRVYHAVGTLRKLGLGDELARGESGWRLTLPTRLR